MMRTRRPQLHGVPDTVLHDGVWQDRYLVKQGSHRCVAECRADNIIRDAEVVRKAMCQDGGGSGLWTLLGQSFGGFCAVSSSP